MDPGRISTTRVTRRVTATERFKAQASGRSHAVLWILLGIGGLFGAVVLGMFLGDGERPEVLAGLFNGYLEDGRKRRAAGDLEGALEPFRAALRLSEEHKSLAPRRLEAVGEIREVKRQQGVRDEFAARVEAVEKDFVRRTSRDLADLRKRLEELGAPATDHPRLREMHRTILGEIEKEKIEAERDDFLRTKLRIHKDCRLDGKDPEWGRAIAEWTKYQARPTVAEGDRLRAKGEIDLIQGRAASELERLKKKDSRDELRRHRPRFEGTAVAAEMDKLLGAR
jgi:hypothetical protein